MSKRVSLDGKGVSIFFGEDDGIQHPAKPTAPPPDTELARSDPGAVALRHPGATAPRLEPANEPTNDAGIAPGIEHPDERAFFESLVLPKSLKRKLRAMSREQHPYHTSVRLTEDEMATLRDLCYELEVKLGIVVKRNDITRVALQLLLEDYALRKKESVLVQVLKEEDQY
jgi:hypothetical protein